MLTTPLTRSIKPSPRNHPQEETALEVRVPTSPWLCAPVSVCSAERQGHCLPLMCFKWPRRTRSPQLLGTPHWLLQAPPSPRGQSFCLKDERPGSACSGRLGQDPGVGTERPRLYTRSVPPVATFPVHLCHHSLPTRLGRTPPLCRWGRCCWWQRRMTYLLACQSRPVYGSLPAKHNILLLLGSPRGSRRELQQSA